MQRKRYDIRGMSCAACVAHVERAVRGVLGEGADFSVSLLTNSISVGFEDAISQEEIVAIEARLRTVISSAGYELLLDAPKETQENSVFKVRIVKLILSAAFTLAVMYLAMGQMIGLPPPSFLAGAQNGLWMALAQLCLTLPVVILNFKFFKNGFSALWHRAPNMDSLIAVGSGAALLYGLVAIVLIYLADDHAAIHERLHDLYFESAAMILTLVSLGKLLESRAKDKASDAVRSLARLTPKTASVLRDGVERQIPTDEIAVGDVILLRAGEWIPVDGEVVRGEGAVDESAMTGESIPVEKAFGDRVRAACVLTSGFLEVRATEVGENTSLSRIVRLIEDAAASKAPIARIADRVSAIFVPVVMAISAATLILWLILTQNIELALRSSIAVLVISCPCALGLATPTAITVAVGRGARRGILFRNAESLEKLCSVQTVLLDKTGTITEGKPILTDLYAYKRDPHELLSLAAAVEKLSSHPLANAIVRAADEASIQIPDATKFANRTAIGVEATVGQVRCFVGKPSQEFYSKSANSSAPDLSDEPMLIGRTRLTLRPDTEHIYADFGRLERTGATTVLIILDGEPCGILGIRDPIRSDSTAAIHDLQSAGVRAYMLTGDNPATAEAVAKETNLDGFYAGLLPEDKERIVRERLTEGSVAMIGDGINDAPALVRADVGIAIGAGTDTAIESADVVLSSPSLVSACEAYRLSRATIRIIKENLFWALFYNAICIPVAAGVLYPIWGIGLSPMIASAAMSFSSVCVVLNALRLRRVRIRPDGLDPTPTTIPSNSCKGEDCMLFRKTTNAKATTYVIKIEGMMCPRCVAHVTKALESVKGVSAVSVVLETNSATVTSTTDPTPLTAAITDAGYEVVSVE